MNSPAGTSTIDEFAPCTWNGSKAFDAWSAASDANCKAPGITDPKVMLSAPLIKNGTSTQAYLV